jgi:hypothetical protein
MVVLELVFPILVAIFNMVGLLYFSFEALFLGGCGNSTTPNSLLFTLSYCYSVSELLC